MSQTKYASPEKNKLIGNSACKHSFAIMSIVLLRLLKIWFFHSYMFSYKVLLKS